MFINNAVNYIALAGQEEWTSSSGTFTWIVPRGVYEIHVCCIGGGGGGGAHATAPAGGGYGGSLAWGNKIPVTPGEQITVRVGDGGGNAIGTGVSGGSGGESYIARGATRLLSAAGGPGGGTTLAGTNQSTTSTAVSGTNSVYGLTDASYSHGGPSYVTNATSSERCSGGGGAAGYASIANIGTITGGIGGPNNTGYTSGTSGGSGGGSGGISSDTGGAGGGTGPWGQGTSGSAASTTGGWAGVGGSGGLPTASFESPPAQSIASAWSASSWSPNAGLFGGGGGGGLNSNPGTGSGFGARGCVRIMWGEGRGYPSTNTGDYYGSTAVTSSQQNYFTPGTYTWTVPAGVREFSVCAIGGGGAGMQGTTTTGKGSGGGGALAWANFKCEPGESFTVVAGAAGQSTALNTATAGGASTVTRNVSFKGFISGTNLYITEMISGLITTAITITGSGVTSTTINAFQTGEYGKEGTYTIGTSQTVGTLDSPITFSGTLLLMTAGGGGAALAVGGGTPSGGTYSVHSTAKSSGGMSGGAGGTSNSSTTAFGGSGGGAGGYQGTAGGAGRNSSSALNGNYPTPYVANRISMTGGSSSGRNGGAAGAMGAGGGGTGIYGTGREPGQDTGQVSSALNSGGVAGSGGQDGTAPAGTGQGGQFGGGGGGSGNNYTAGRANGGIGGVRITWGARHKYPAPTTDV